MRNRCVLIRVIACSLMLLCGCEDKLDDLVHPGEQLDIHPAFSLHDDDTMDANIPSSSPGEDRYGGYATTFFALTHSVGITPCISMEGKRVGFTSTNPALNYNGKVIKQLHEKYGWEVMAHTMTAPYVSESYVVDSLNSELAQCILREGKNESGYASMATTSVYDEKTGGNYYVSKNLSEWLPLPKEWTRPYVKDYVTKNVMKYNPSFPIDYQWGRYMELASKFGFDIKTGVIPAATGSHACVNEIRRYMPNLFEIVGEIPQYNTVPLTTTVHRISLEGSSTNSRNNLYSERVLNQWKEQVDKAAKNHGWIIFYMHSYLQCWRNCLDEELVSNGGSYPDEWVNPIKESDDVIAAHVTPPARLGIQNWSEWKPCPGTRLMMVYELLQYMKEKGLDNLTSSEGFSRFGNILTEGIFCKGGQIGMDRNWIEGTKNNYPYHIIGVNGVELRNPK